MAKGKRVFGSVISAFWAVQKSKNSTRLAAAELQYSRERSDDEITKTFNLCYCQTLQPIAVASKGL